MPNLDEVLGYGKDSTDETIDEEEVEVLW
jgi:hypothetical protein